MLCTLPHELKALIVIFYSRKTRLTRSTCRSKQFNLPKRIWTCWLEFVFFVMADPTIWVIDLKLLKQPIWPHGGVHDINLLMRFVNLNTSRINGSSCRIWKWNAVISSRSSSETPNSFPTRLSQCTTPRWIDRRRKYWPWVDRSV